ncbi:MAG: hypothetical protein A2268_09285 [Candidatus Raymondbacteria bacterium RifOxyA12_full_50_37]|uniref:Secretion system C-terminal sorting domain-containing protein n=1 Tax=Candidatus Raymondbacteria bacterium RIFOXYD12_FULL_49_13 TaxID=1817890 RepID=A0A1F7FGR1_UNCRA|nr:MAG: hypothetical protein A2268_09285 [Candidatus Raymondbacteria bacterium RifOxyA12_full_50_37]OGJ91558.1 MAG: hypothetical protein A2248_09835 [Candidatus Raymondbacteria bacterium RIFOXYA2_FULL_49_16]OGJ95479.1 MAG: hypothetical protein A2350_11860 [Candidatus Raymondbacteria bacterium RifOxyB12_full_50_8]OGK05662.1 MAG: hypothetical protein A2519_06155 [Candidatus Raymondbacteria bacterium RIFOXYD12_FULL_49_13]OGP43820.1 MAG: hypothetical protein A2324_20010 [Candidatus Raymondbacteria 
MAYAQTNWPPASCGCTEWHRQHVEEYAPCAANTLVKVSHLGGDGAINFMQFLNQLNKTDSTTYIIEASTQPYLLGCRMLTIGESAQRTCVMVKGETGRKEDVVLVGLDPATSPDYWKSSEYGGPSTCGVTNFLGLRNVEHFVIADLTIRNFPGKMIKIDGGPGYFGKDIIMHNIDLWDCGSQMIKVAAANGYVSSRDAVLECSFLHYSDALFEESTYETQGISIHAGVNWTIRYNHFLNMRQGNWGDSYNSDAILIWNDDSMFVYGNLIENCNMGARLGFSTSGGNYMRAYNNIVVATDTDPRFSYGVAFEVGPNVTHGGVFHNTIWNPAAAGSMSSCYNQIPVRNNLYFTGSINSGCSAADNVIIAGSSVFSSAGTNDFHVIQPHQAPFIPEVTVDIEGKPRHNPATAGAYEYPADNTEFLALLDNEAMDLAVYPNPFTAGTTIAISGPAAIRHAMVTIYDIYGHLVRNLPVTNSGPDGRMAWKTEGLSSGIYLITMAVHNKIMTKRAIVLR